MPTSVKTFFDEKVPAVLDTSPEKVKDVAAVYLFKISRRRRRHLDRRPGVVAAHAASRASTGRPSARSRRATPTSAA